MRAAAQISTLEDEAVHIVREVIGQCKRPAVLFSGGKDSAVLVHVIRKALHPAPIPFPALHINTGHNFPEVIRFRDRYLAAAGIRLVVADVQTSIDGGRVTETPGMSRNPLQTVTLRDAIAEHRFDAVLGGARRDEEKARAKERIFSVRNAFGQWDPHAQRPELWDLYSARVAPGAHVRVFPLSNWTELEVWRYIDREGIALPSLYYAHERAVVEREGMLLGVTPWTPAAPGEHVRTEIVRYRTVGDATCTGAVRSLAQTVAEVVAEVAASAVTERGATRADDRTGEAAMEDRKREGYF